MEKFMEIACLKRLGNSKHICGLNNYSPMTVCRWYRNKKNYTKHIYNLSKIGKDNRLKGQMSQILNLLVQIQWAITVLMILIIILV